MEYLDLDLTVTVIFNMCIQHLDLELILNVNI